MKAVRRVRPRPQLDSYFAREQYKKQAHFLHNVNWEILNNMNLNDLTSQVNTNLKEGALPSLQGGLPTGKTTCVKA